MSDSFHNENLRDTVDAIMRHWTEMWIVGSVQEGQIDSNIQVRVF